ncbi:MAG: hypothetical protein ACFCU7_00420 [Pleurocapsa sp.]
MDSNVSKNTISHKFFKLRLEREKAAISVKNLLKQQLLLSLNLYQQQLNKQIDLEFMAAVLERKIVLSIREPGQLSDQSKAEVILSPPKFTPIMYSCPIGLDLASAVQMPPPIIIEQIGNLLTSKQANLAAGSELKLLVETVSSGWINFYLDSEAIAGWLKRSQLVIAHQTNPRSYSATAGVLLDCGGNQTSDNLFAVQYIHARCCSLLQLAAREKAIAIQDFDCSGWQIIEPQLISWADEEHNLWLTELSAQNLIYRLLSIVDSFGSNSPDWVKLAGNLSLDTAIFLADCRFLGQIKQQCPQKAIARLGLIAFVQYWLQKILVEKLKVAAPKTL